jgi:hypothetical protein
MAAEPNEIAKKYARLSAGTLRVHHSGAHRHEMSSAPNEASTPVISYRISSVDTTPESWVLERITNESSHPEQLILFETRAEAQAVLAAFSLRIAP